MSGKNGRKDNDVIKRIEQYTDALAQELGEGARLRESVTILRINSRDSNNWDKMVDWLEDRRAIYERVLLQSDIR